MIYLQYAWGCIQLLLVELASTLIFWEKQDRSIKLIYKTSARYRAIQRDNHLQGTIRRNLYVDCITVFIDRDVVSTCGYTSTNSASHTRLNFRAWLRH